MLDLRNRFVTRRTLASEEVIESGHILMAKRALAHPEGSELTLKRLEQSSPLVISLPVNGHVLLESLDLLLEATNRGLIRGRLKPPFHQDRES